MERWFNKIEMDYDESLLKQIGVGSFWNWNINVHGYVAGQTCHVGSKEEEKVTRAIFYLLYHNKVYLTLHIFKNYNVFLLLKGINTLIYTGLNNKFSIYLKIGKQLRRGIHK